MLSFALDVRETQQQFEGLARALERQQPQLLVQLGEYLVGEAHQDFLVKAHGGTGDDGTRWGDLTAPQSRLKERIGKPLTGIRSGELGRLSNIRATVGTSRTLQGPPGLANEVAIAFIDQPKAIFFDDRRPLLPDRLPHPWYRHAQSLLDDQVQQLAAQAVT